MEGHCFFCTIKTGLKMYLIHLVESLPAYTSLLRKDPLRKRKCNFIGLDISGRLCCLLIQITKELFKKIEMPKSNNDNSITDYFKCF